jgi:hypothetical protein
MDSGITIFRNLNNLKDTIRIKNLLKVKYISVSGDLLACSNLDNYLYVYKLNNGIPSSRIFRKKYDNEIGAVYLDSTKLYLSGVNGLTVMAVNKDRIDSITFDNRVRNIITFTWQGWTIFL